MALLRGHVVLSNKKCWLGFFPKALLFASFNNASNDYFLLWKVTLIMLRSTSWFYICVVLMLICAGCTQAQHQENTAQRSSVKVNGADRYNSDTYKAASAIQVASSESKHLTDEQLAFLNSHIDDPDNLVRLQVIVALRHASSEQKQAAIAVARKGLKSMDSMTRLYTLTTLDKLDAPDIVSIAKRMSNDRSQYVRPEAERILKKRGA